MKFADIEKLILRLRYKPRPQMREKILSDILRIFEESNKIQPAAYQPSIWRLIMKTKITKLTAAAVIIIAVLIGINHFGGSIDGATIAFAEVKEAMQKVSWMHSSSRSLNNDCKSTIVEEWTGYEREIQAEKWTDGKAVFWDSVKQRKYIYKPKANSISVEVTRGDSPGAPMLTFVSPVLFLDMFFHDMEKMGAEITTRFDKYQGQRVQITELETPDIVADNKEKYSIKLYIEPESKLILAVEMKIYNSNGTLILYAETTFDYPDNGPKDIYDLGVPKDAKIIDDTKK